MTAPSVDPSADDTVLVETAGATRIVTLNRPRARNALTLPMLSHYGYVRDVA